MELFKFGYLENKFSFNDDNLVAIDALSAILTNIHKWQTQFLEPGGTS
jgi:hypothetical protein